VSYGVRDLDVGVSRAAESVWPPYAYCITYRKTETERARATKSINVTWVLENLVDMSHVRITIGAIPDDALLQIFHVLSNEAERTEEWHVLVHV
jgi:hypothetical protein